MAEQELDRNQPATPHKLEKARERGQAAKSMDVAGAVVVLAAIIYLAWRGWGSWLEQFRFDRALLSLAGRGSGDAHGSWLLVDRLIRSGLTAAAPFFATVMLAGVVANVAQTGPILSADPIRFDWTRLNPATGLKRLLSARSLFMGFRAVLKLCVLTVVAYLVLRAMLPELLGLASLSPLAQFRGLLDGLAHLGFRLALALGLIAVLDYGYTRRDFAKQMRMSHRELKEEYKNREGDPRIRARLKELRRELLRRVAALRRTKDASVVITNPTHVAVALRYVHGDMPSPQLVAKGAGPLAAAIRHIASRHGIPVVQNRRLARTLFRQLPVDGHVPPALYSEVARIVVWAMALRQRPAAAVDRAAPTGGAE